MRRQHDIHLLSKKCLVDLVLLLLQFNFMSLKFDLIRPSLQHLILPHLPLPLLLPTTTINRYYYLLTATITTATTTTTCSFTATIITTFYATTTTISNVTTTYTHFLVTITAEEWPQKPHSPPQNRLSPTRAAYQWFRRWSLPA